jgi:hypothetical protein
MDKKKISTGMYAFRVTLRAKNTNNGSSEILVQHRQSHRKSRAGCKACRLRHRKVCYPIKDTFAPDQVVSKSANHG